MTASAILENLKSCDVKIRVIGANRLQVDAPKNKLSPEQREQLRLYKAQIINELSPRCPVCTCKAEVEQSEALQVTFCPLGCPFLVCRFIENKPAVYQAVKEMFEAMTADQLEAVQDALTERTSVFMYETDCDYETAFNRAEQDLLPVLLDRFTRQRKLQQIAT